jgi:CRISPR-associated protein Csb1
LKLYRDALAGLKAAKLPIQLEEIVLTPSPDLVTLVKRSLEIAAVTTEGDN